jgi:hypothetical protein
MNEGTIPQMTAEGPPDGKATDKLAAIAVHLRRLARYPIMPNTGLRVENRISQSDWDESVMSLFTQIYEGTVHAEHHSRSIRQGHRQTLHSPRLRS